MASVLPPRGPPVGGGSAPRRRETGPWVRWIPERHLMPLLSLVIPLSLGEAGGGLGTNEPPPPGRGHPTLSLNPTPEIDLPCVALPRPQASWIRLAWPVQLLRCLAAAIYVRPLADCAEYSVMALGPVRLTATYCPAATTPECSYFRLQTQGIIRPSRVENQSPRQNRTERNRTEGAR